MKQRASKKILQKMKSSNLWLMARVMLVRMRARLQYGIWNTGNVQCAMCNSKQPCKVGLHTLFARVRRELLLVVYAFHTASQSDFIQRNK